MKYLIKFLLIFTFILPVATVSASPHEDATMDVLEHSDSLHYENEIELPRHDDDEHEKNHDDNKSDDKDDEIESDSHDEKDDSEADSHEEKDEYSDDDSHHSSKS